MKYKYKNSVLGGTFDRFHLGHQKLIDSAFSESEKVTIGIASKELYKNKYLSDIIEGYKTRLVSVRSYIEAKYSIDRVNFLEISDIFGNSLTERGIEAIFVTVETYKNAELINKKRREIGLKPLDIVSVDFFLGDDRVPVTSERIRKGEIDREGKSYLKLFSTQKKYILRGEDREQFKKPIGRLIKNLKGIEKIFKNKPLTIAVGDIVAVDLFEKGLSADINVVDHRTQRHAVNSQEKQILDNLSKSQNVLTADNSPGTIERRAVGVINKALGKFFESNGKQIILVNGEEDLLTIPAVLLSPLESIVLYGQPDRGIVVVTVTEKKKREVKNLLKKFI